LSVSKSTRTPGKWEARIRVDGRYLRKTFARRADAVAWEAAMRHDRDRGIAVDMSNRTTVAEYFAIWLDRRAALRHGSRRKYETLLRTHLEPEPLGARPIVRVLPGEFQEWAKSRTTLGPETLRLACGVLRSAFASAVEDRLIPYNPVPKASGLSLPKACKPKIVPLTVAQVLAWADAAEPRVRAMILTQAGLGLRIAELLALRVADVDFLRREVHITEQIDRTGSRAPLKTPNSRRVVPLPQVTAEALSEHLSAFPPGPFGLIFTPGPAKTTDRLGRRRPTGRPRSVTRAGTWVPQAAMAAYRAARDAAGLPGSYTSHDLRHHYASVLLDAGESVHAVAERLGDKPGMVLSVYGHMMPGREDTTRKAVDAAWQAGEAARRDAR
jgi:integrase